MRKFGIATAVMAALLLPACSGDDEPAAEATAGGQTSAGESSGAPDAEENSNSGSGEVDLTKALLTAEDLPPSATVEAFDATTLTANTESFTNMMDEVTYEPAECKNNDADPFGRTGVEAAGMTAILDTDVFVQAVYSGAEESDIDNMKDYYEKCSEVAITGGIAGQQMEMTMTTAPVDPPPVEADDVVAMETNVSATGVPAPGMRVIYLRDGDHGIFLSGTSTSTNFDLNALAVTALERLREARG